MITHSTLLYLLLIPVSLSIPTNKINVDKIPSSIISTAFHGNSPSYDAQSPFWEPNGNGLMRRNQITARQTDTDTEPDPSLEPVFVPTKFLLVNPWFIPFMVVAAIIVIVVVYTAVRTRCFRRCNFFKGNVTLGERDR